MTNHPSSFPWAKIIILFIMGLFIIACILAIASVTNASAQAPEDDISTRMAIERPYVIDGDTVRILSTNETIRIIGVDTPEVYNPHCKAERDAGYLAMGRLQFLIRRGNVSMIRFKGTDKYNRSLGRIFVGENEVAKLLIREGYGVLYDGKSRRTHWRDTLCPGVSLNASSEPILR